MPEKEEISGLIAGDFGSSRLAQHFFEGRGSDVTHPQHHMRVGVHGLSFALAPTAVRYVTARGQKA